MLYAAECNDAYARYRVDEPWDTANNRRLLDLPFYERVTLFGRDGHCVYLALRDDTNNWLRGPDPIVVVCFESSNVFWTEPLDLIVNADGIFRMTANGTRTAVDLSRVHAVRRSGWITQFPDKPTTDFLVGKDVW
jgi:hypothetical protein